MNFEKRFPSTFDHVWRLKDEYLISLTEDYTSDEVFRRIYSIYKEYIEDSSTRESVMFWIVAALIQWNYDILTDIVKNKAVEVIKTEAIKNIDWIQYDEYHLFYEWNTDIRDLLQEEFSEILKLITSVNPKPSQIRKRKYFKCNWEVGEILTFQMKFNESNNPSNNKFAAIVKLGEIESYPRHINALVAFFDWEGDELPNQKHFFENMDIKYIEDNKLILTEMYFTTTRNSNYKKIVHFGNLSENNKIFSINIDEYELKIYNSQDCLTNSVLTGISGFKYKESL